MSVQIIQEFHSSITSSYPSYKQTTGRAYGNMDLNPRSRVSIFVQSKNIKIELWTNGGEGDLSADALIDWANKTGILRDEILPDLYFELVRGTRNKAKASVQVRIPLGGIEHLDDEVNRDAVLKALELIDARLATLATIKERKKSVEKTELVNEDTEQSAQGGEHCYLMRIGISGYFESGDFEDDLEHAVTKSADILLHHGLLLKERGIQSESFYIVGKKADSRHALKVEMDGDVDRMELLEKIEDALFSKFPSNEYYSGDSEAVNMIFQAEETEDGDLWDFEFNRMAEESEADLSIIGWHSHHEDFAIQQWGGGEYDEGIESNPDAEDYYVGLESGENLKHENLKELDFKLESYTTDILS